MTDNIGYGKEKRRAGNLRVLAGEQTFRCLCLSRDIGLNFDLGTTVGMLSVRCWTAWLPMDTPSMSARSS